MLSGTRLPLMPSSEVPFPCVPTTVVFLLLRIALPFSAMRKKRSVVNDTSGLLSFIIDG